MIRRALSLGGTALLLISCGPQRPAGYFVYEGRRGDTLAALSERYGGGARLRQTLAAETGRDADAAFAAGERLAIRFESLKRHRDVREAFVLVHEARERGAAGDYAAAAEALTAARAVRPDDPSFAFELGAVYYEAGDYGRAAAALAEASDLAPEDEEVTVLLALAEAERGEEAKAATRLEALATSRPEFPYGRYVLGEIQIRAGDYAAGRHHLFVYLRGNADGLVARYAREGIKRSARREMEAAAAARAEETEKSKGETTPAREAGPPR